VLVNLTADRFNPDAGNELAVRPLAAREFDQIRQLAYRECGLDIKPGKEELVSARLQRLVKGGPFRTFHEYYESVVKDSTGKALASMIDALTTNHTAFLREPAHFEFFRQEVMPILAARNPIEIWCAACATGEEVWTLAFFLNEAFQGRKIQICASDISNKALRFAEQALYSAERRQGLPPAWLSRYFVPEPDVPRSYRVAPRIRAQASFRRLNLIGSFSWPRQFPVIFCRNVMIYFDRKTQEQVVRRLSDCLEPGGYFFTGHAESLTGVSHQLEYVRPAVYRKPGKKENKWP
jgi:chemotaxis protein methyltransferase CheR